MQRKDIETGDCVEIIRGKHKGKLGIVEDFVLDDYAAVRVVFKIGGTSLERFSIPVPMANLEKCKK